ncbi:MAG: HD domain-containing protein [Lachnospiraceae bacterium]|nr:HD domain-containing protein [Lachnospiraceae bacterium]
MEEVRKKILKNKNIPWVILMCAVALVLNLSGASLASAIHLPIYLDTIGTLLAAIIGGYLPGIFVGFVSNFIKASSDPTAIYYECLSVIMAVVASWFEQKGYLRRFGGIVAFTVIASLIGGGLGSLLTWFLYGFAAEGITVPFVKQLYESGSFSPFMAQITGDVFIDFVDKVINMIFILPIYILTPENIRRKFRLNGWQQNPLEDKDELRAGSSNNRSISIRTKMMFMITSALMIIAIVSTVIGYSLYLEDSIENHRYLAEGVASTVAGVVEPYRINDYIDLGYSAIGYVRTENNLYDIRNSSPDIEYLYVYRILPDGCHVVFDLDTDDLKGAEAGEIIPFDDSFAPYIDALLAGEEIEPIITDDTYGWLLTVYKPIVDENGVTQAYACIDISMDRLRSNGYAFLAKQISLFIGTFILILAIGLWIIRYNLIYPVNTMAMAATNFAYHMEDQPDDSVDRVKALQICTGDEIENLYMAFSKMTEDSVDYVNEIQEKTDTIQEMQNSLILVLADMVESRDKNTGDHVRKTAIYTDVIMKELIKEGIYTDVLTPEFVNDVYNSAPLHDIGKISVSDVILNKPGKLTDEEFAEMKKHTTAGSEIISRVIEMVPESSYLYTAKDLAEFHHEKWNGTGYPHGISGEEIPLSARIMAVADVFDALVSKRSYKEGMPVEKALGIIREGIGTHFDPYVAQAFLNAEEEVRKVLEGKWEA